jgi:hypothetical protein
MVWVGEVFTSFTFTYLSGEGCFHQTSKEVFTRLPAGRRNLVRYRTELFDSLSQFLLCRCMAS